MEKKMCFYAIGSWGCDNTDGDCPKNTNSKCEIVAKKKYKRVKAWFTINEFGEITATTYRIPFYKENPCTILIEAKYLKAKR